MIDMLLAKLRLYDTVSPVEEKALQDAAGEAASFARGDSIVKADTELLSSNLVVEGLAHRFKDLVSGQRQSMEVGIPGDFLDLHSFLMKRIDHDIAALTDCRVVCFPHERLAEITVAQPHLARVLWLQTIIDSAIHREWILSLGARNAFQRLAHFFCEMYVRLQAVGLAAERQFELAITQERLADLLGLTQVHINRTLGQFRNQHLLAFRSGVVEFFDWQRVCAIAEFDPRYLGMQRRPR